MPALGFDMTAGAVARWLKKEGDVVKQGEAIAEVDTEKATVEIQAFGTGTLQKILVPPGQNVPVGTVIGVIAAPGESASVPTPSVIASEAKQSPSRDLEPRALQRTQGSASPEGSVKSIASSQKPLLAMTKK